MRKSQFDFIVLLARTFRLICAMSGPEPSMAPGPMANRALPIIRPIL
jgi:hypothetical protein